MSTPTPIAPGQTLEVPVLSARHRQAAARLTAAADIAASVGIGVLA